MLSTKPTQPVFFVNDDEKMTKMTKTFWIIVDETKTKMKTKTRDENEIEINSILVDDIDENIWIKVWHIMLASVWQNNEGYLSWLMVLFVWLVFKLSP